MSLGSSSGLAKIFDDQRADLRRFLLARSGSEPDADDLLSELWIKVNSTPTGPLTNPRSYLFRMANNLVLDKLRETHRRQRREGAWLAEQHDPAPSLMDVRDPDIGPEQSLIEKDEAQRLSVAIGQLPAGAQRVLRMHKFEGLGHGEVAERLGISKSAVEKHMALAMTHLRRILATEAGQGSRRLDDNKGRPVPMDTGLES